MFFRKTEKDKLFVFDQRPVDGKMNQTKIK